MHALDPALGSIDVHTPMPEIEPLGSQQHPLGHCALACVLPRSTFQPQLRSDTHAVCRQCWAGVAGVFDLLRSAQRQPLTISPATALSAFGECSISGDFTNTSC